MTRSGNKVPLYPKSHLLAASGVAALLSLALLVFPSREVEAKKTHFSLDMDSSTERAIRVPETLQGDNASLEMQAPPPFTQLPNASDENALAAQKAGDAQPDSEIAAAVEVAEPADPLSHSVTVANGDTLSTVFAKVGLSGQDVHNVLGSSKEAKQLSRLNIGQVLDFTMTAEGQLDSLTTKISALETLTLTQRDGRYTLAKEKAKPVLRERYARGTIDSSLFLAASRAGLPQSMTFDLANIFGYDIDFAMDLRKGDEFEVIYEDKHVDGKKVGNGNILAARFVNRGKTYTAVRYVDKQGSASYYTASGDSMRKAFIRTPVEFARISSRFSSGRMHPVLHKMRAHKGVDYAAPRGTPIKATGDGKVILAGVKGGYGNTIIVQHGNRYRTLYAHMQGFAKGMKSGATVKQGQVIGYIGATGLATGPHLHYEFHVNGVHVDPLGEKLPMADPIAGNEKQRFMQRAQPLMARMDQERDTTLAMNTKSDPDS
ncbi:peptidoglycan DD-metalloendopeptidase family protein [Pseudomonas sp. Marseille-QA0892]